VFGFRAWAEDEAKRVSTYAVALERARDRCGRNGVKVVDDDLFEYSTHCSFMRNSSRFKIRLTGVITYWTS